MRRTDLHSFLLAERLRLTEAIGLAQQAFVFLTDEQRALLDAQAEKVVKDYASSAEDFKRFANAVIAGNVE